MKQYVKLSDVRNMLDNACDHADLEKRYSELKVYNAEYKPYMPIRLRDYGNIKNGKPNEFDCGQDSHHWLQITDDGKLHFHHLQNGSGSMNAEAAETFGECCFIPNFETDLWGHKEKYITPRTYLVIDEGDEDCPEK